MALRSEDRRRHRTPGATVALVGCGGGTTSAPQNNVTPSTTVAITITGNSGVLQHFTTANITMN